MVYAKLFQFVKYQFEKYQFQFTPTWARYGYRALPPPPPPGQSETKVVLLLRPPPTSEVDAIKQESRFRCQYPCL